MVTANPVSDASASQGRRDACLLVLVAASQSEELDALLAHLAVSFPGHRLLIAAADGIAAEAYPDFSFVPAAGNNASWILTAADFVQAHELAQKNDARAILILGRECTSLEPSALRDLADPVLNSTADISAPNYELNPLAGLVNSAILYPLSRALFASRARYPLAIDLGLSLRMAERMAVVAQRFIALNQADAPLWPVNEAIVAGYIPRDVNVGARMLPQPAEPDLNTILPLVTGSLFSDIDAKASFWQRPRSAPSQRSSYPGSRTADMPPEVTPMIEGFRLAFINLQEIWSLVLPPNSLLRLKRLSASEGSAFRMPDSLWARIVYDFLLAYRLRTIHRGHLLGALIPLYLAWVASHINEIASGVDPEQHIEAVAAAFEADKPYLVSRWRWPDRFSP